MRQFVAERGGSARLLRMPELGTMDFKARDVLTRECQRCALVCVDDFHRLRFGLEANLDWLHSFVDGLYRNRVATVVTANGSFDQVRNVATQSPGGRDYLATFDRLRDGGLLQVKATGESRRA
jgi:DNA replication protein DnaC